MPGPDQPLARCRGFPWAAWLAPLVVLTLAAGPAASQLGFEDGEAVAVWMHKEGTAGSANHYDVWYSVLGPSGGPGNPLVWRARNDGTPGTDFFAPIAVLAGDDRHPAISIDPVSRRTVAVWEHDSGDPVNGREIFWAEFLGDEAPNPTGWSAPQPVAVLAGDDFDPAVALDSDGTAIACWVHYAGLLPGDMNAPQIFCSLHDGSSWTAPQSIDTNPAHWKGRASLPEITFTGVETDPGAMTLHELFLVYSEKVAESGGGPAGSEPAHQPFYSIFDGMGWVIRPTTGEVSGVGGLFDELPGTNTVADIMSADYANPFGAFQRIGVAADDSGFVYPVWTGDNVPQDEIDFFADSDFALGAQVPLASPSGLTMSCQPGQLPPNCFMGISGCKASDVTMTAPSFEVVALFDFNQSDSVEDSRRFDQDGNPATVDDFFFSNEDLAFSGANSQDSVANRPAASAISTGVVGIAYSLDVDVSTPPPPAMGDREGEIVWSLGVLTGVSDVVWNGGAAQGQRLDPAGDLPGDDRYPDIASFRGGTTNPFTGPPLGGPAVPGLQPWALAALALLIPAAWLGWMRLPVAQTRRPRA